MKFSEQWLRTLVDPPVSTEEICEQLTMAGLEVDSVTPVAGEFSDVVVARVESVDEHPDAKKLHVCQVNDGNEVVQIVCGAANVRPGLIAPLARVGAVLPTGMKIKAAQLRGVQSNGMLCSEQELGLAEQARGLLELPADAPVGTPLRDYLLLDDVCIELDLTPNRGDCLSVTGIARELAALNDCDIREYVHAPYRQSIDASFPVEIEASQACSHYVGRIISDIDAGAPTPVWMVERLRRSGIRSLNAIVDITNYVMLLVGQPMHAFDLATLKEKIVVKFADKGDKITLLDGKIIKLGNEDLLITDAGGPLAMAGIMGGEHSGVSAGTKAIFLESAFFAPECIAGRARAYGLHTDSSHRFERGVDPQLQVHAMDIATELVLAICGGQVGPLSEVTTEAHPRPHDYVPIQLRSERIKRVLGLALNDEQVTGILQRLGMQVKTFSDGVMVMPPSYRFDVRIEADLLEELVRIHGYNTIPRTLPAYQPDMMAQSERTIPLTRVRDSLVARGYFEAISYSFVDPNWQRLLDPESDPVALANPLSSEMSVMRTTLWPGLVQAVGHNLNRQHDRVRLFETGLCFRPQDDGLAQVAMIAGAVSGRLNPLQWATDNAEVDFYDIKADVEALLGHHARPPWFNAQQHPALHPGRSARIMIAGEPVGWVGALHPQLQRELDISQRVFLFELNLKSVQSADLPAFRPLSKFPEVRRDVAIVVDEAVSIGAISDSIRQVSSDLLQDHQIFDIYTDKSVGKGRKSVAFSLILQEFSRTLTDQEVDAEVEKVLSTLSSQFAATLRE